jgi:hypothetical protein
MENYPICSGQLHSDLRRKCLTYVQPLRHFKKSRQSSQNLVFTTQENVMLKTKLLIAASVLALSPAIHADTLASGAMYGGPSQTNAVCYIYNAGTGPVSINSRTLSREPGVVLAPFYNNCGVGLAAGKSCGFAANVVNNAAHFCRVVVSPSGADVRGTIEMRDAQGRVLTNADLR